MFTFFVFVVFAVLCNVILSSWQDCGIYGEFESCFNFKYVVDYKTLVLIVIL